MEEMLIELFESAPIMVSFLAGVLTFFSPCVLPLIPAYLSYMSGLSIKQLDTDHHGFNEQLRILKASLMFISGFGLIFILLGASMADLVEDIFAYSWVTWIAGGIIVVFGLHFMGVINIKLLNYEVHADLTKLDHQDGSFISRIAHKFAPFLLGISFALGWTPCIGPIFAAIVSLAAQEGSSGLTLMIVYTIGLAIPFLMASMLTHTALQFFNKVKKNMKAIEIISGVLLIIIGIAIATGGLGTLSTTITDFFS